MRTDQPKAIRVQTKSINSQTRKNNNMSQLQLPNPMPSNQPKPVVEVKAVTWDKDSHGLFDYENSYYDMRKFQIAKPVVIGRNRNEINCWSKTHNFSEQDRQDTEFLLSISQNPEERANFTVDVPGQFNNHEQYPVRHNYLIVRSLKCRDGRNQRGYQLKPGEIIKLGRVEYRVREIKIRKPNGNGTEFEILTTEEETHDFMSGLPNDEVFDATEQGIKNKNDPNLTCRYCFQKEISDDEMENLLINPCDCKGSSGMVHLMCLMNWIQYKIISKNTNNIATYSWKKLQCEVCTRNWPRSICFKNEVRSLISVEKPEFPYIILEKQNTDSTTNLKSNSLSLIVPSEDAPIKLGRGHQCDLRISDISVSRIHAFLKFENNKFLIFDNDSKFGTLIKLKKPYQVMTDKAAVQIGRTVFTFVLKYSKSSRSQYNQLKEEIKSK